MRIVVALSGGVDSAVAALLLRREGHDVQALFMQNWDEDDRYCTSAQDFQDARAVATELGIPLHRVNFTAQYRKQVFDYFLSEYRAGRTPNPDVLCNREIKFGVALKYARRLGGELLATGHYARLVQAEGGVELHKAADLSKDQSYFLHALDASQLAAARMPLGTLPKSEVRSLAREAGLPVYDKPDSTGICFVGERPFREFLARFISCAPGPIETPGGEVLGMHAGLPFYTLGQRQGLALGGQRGHAEQPWYVAAKDGQRNVLIVVQETDHPLLLSESLETAVFHWMGPPRAGDFRCAAKVRYRQGDQPAEAIPLPEGRIRLSFDQPQRAVTPGQFAVLYEGTRCLGGAAIDIISNFRAAIVPARGRRLHG
jgi:tRNA-specific 2-thiouridylase